MRANPIAHFVTGHGGLHGARIPRLVDLEAGNLEDGDPVRLRGHLNARNPESSRGLWRRASCAR
ncbi:MAG: hypothetical protein ACLFQ5_07395 [Oceanicaulis sp.]